MSTARQMQFIGRAAELATLRAVLEAGRGGESGVAVVEGDAGLGKTALLDELAATTDATVLRVSGGEAETVVPLGVVDQLFRATGAAAGRAGGTSEVRSYPDAIAAGAALLDNLGALDGFVLITLDDAQWADLPSLQALQFALRRLQYDPIVVVVATRSTDDSLDGIRRLAARPPGTHVVLGPMSPGELRELGSTLGVGTLSHAGAVRLQEHSGGHPLHAAALLHEVPVEIVNDLDRPLPAPRSFAELTLMRVAAQPADVRRLVAAAAVLGQRCSVDEAAAVSEVGEPLVALDLSVTANLIHCEPGPGPAEMRFHHPLIRAAIYHDLGIAARTSLHSRAASVLRDPDQVLDHRVAAAVGADAALAEALADAGRSAKAARAFGRARSRFDAASRHTDDPVTARSHLHAALGCAIRDDDVTSIRRLLGDLGAARPDDSSYGWFVSGEAAMVLGDHHRAGRDLAEAWERRDERNDPSTAARIAGRSAGLAMFAMRHQQAVEWGGRAIELDPDALDLPFHGISLALCGQRSEGERLLGEVDIDEAERLLARGALLVFSERLGGANEALRAAIAGLRASSPARCVPAGVVAGMGAYRSCAWDDALGYLEMAISTAREADMGHLSTMHRALVAAILAGRGRFAEASRYLDDAQRLASNSMPLPIAAVAIGRAYLAVTMGEPDTAAREIESVLPSLQAGDPVTTVNWATPYALALVQLGRLDEADEVIEPFSRAAQTFDLPLSIAGAHRAHAAIARGRGDRSATVDHLTHAVEVSSTVGPSIEQAIADLELGAELRRDGKRRDATDHLERALRTLDRADATPLIDRATRELAACGLSPRTRRDARWESLTPTELSVAGLVARGATNRETAAELFVSPKTVEFHLGNIYRKLDITSRSKLAAALGNRSDHAAELDVTPGHDQN